MFLQQLQHDPAWYFMIVICVIISIVLHELAHGWMAIRLGDDTPIVTGHMTGNPLVHMGWWSIAVLCIMGIAWGQMPINPSRIRGRFGEALVAAAGPAMNLLLAIVSLTALGLWWRFANNPDMAWHLGIVKFLFVFGKFNLILCAFNLMPVPPLDGSHILANFHRGYAMLISDPAKQQVFLFAFFFVFMVMRQVMPWLHNVAMTYAQWVEVL